MRTIAWPLEPGEIEEVFRALRFRHFKWDVYCRGRPGIMADALVLSEDDHAEVAWIAEAVWRAMQEIERALISRSELLAAAGIPEELHDAIRRERPRNPRLSRCDLHRTIDGRWVVSELNEDGPGGLVDSAGLREVLSSRWADRFEGLRFAGNPRERIVEALSAFERVGLVYPTSISEDLQHVALVADWLKDAGKETALGSPVNLTIVDGEAAVFHRPVDAVFRYFPGETIGELPNAEVWKESSASLPMMNGLSALVTQSKRAYAAAAEHELSLSEEAREAIESHLPRSVYLDASRRDEIVAERGRWVLKGIFGRTGESVRLGAASRPEDWERAVDEALLDPGAYVVQELFEAAPMWFSTGLGYATVGAFLVDGCFTGYYSRADKSPVINYESSHVATLVEVS